MADQLQRLGVAVGEDRHLSPVRGQRRGEVAQLAVDLDRQRRLGEAGADRGRRVGARRPRRQLQRLAVRQGDGGLLGRGLHARAMVRGREPLGAAVHWCADAQRAGPWRAWRSAISGQGLLPRTGEPFPERRQGAQSRPQSAKRHEADARATKRPGGGSLARSSRDADATAAQFPGDEGFAVFVVEQLAARRHERRPFADQRRTRSASGSRRSGRRARWRARAASRRPRRRRRARQPRIDEPRRGALSACRTKRARSSSGRRMTSATSGAAISIALAAV